MSGRLRSPWLIQPSFPSVEAGVDEGRHLKFLIKQPHIDLMQAGEYLQLGSTLGDVKPRKTLEPAS